MEVDVDLKPLQGADGGQENVECLKGEVISSLGRVKATLEWLRSGSTDPPACLLSMEGATDRSTIDWLDEESVPSSGFAQWLQSPNQRSSPAGGFSGSYWKDHTRPLEL